MNETIKFAGIRAMAQLAFERYVALAAEKGLAISDDNYYVFEGGYIAGFVKGSNDLQ